MNTYKNIIKELRIIAQKTHQLHEHNQLEKQKTILEYKKLQLIKAGKSIDAINNEINSLAITSKPSDKFEQLFKKLHQEASDKDIINSHQAVINDNNFHNIYTFLNSQRTYQELLERYNPGINFDQTENVSKSAERVGLRVPQ